jgi:O-antigen ligase
MNNRLAKKFFQYGFFFIYPITAMFISDIELVDFTVNSEMVWMAAATCLLFLLIIESGRRIRFSGISIALTLYYLFAVANSAGRGYLGGEFFVKTNVALMLLSFCMVLLIDNLKFYPKDRQQFFKLLPFLIFITFVGILLQVYVDNSLFWVTKTYEELQKIDFRGFWRNASIFDAMMQDQGCIAFIMMLLLFIFKDIKLKDNLNIATVVLLFTIGYFTFTRYVLLSMFLIATIFSIIYFQYKKIDRGLAILLIAGTVIIISFFAWTFSSYITSSDFYQERILADISGRTSDPENFLLDHLREHPIMLGTGFSSYLNEYYYGHIRRLHSGIWDLLFQGGIVGLSLFIFFLYQLHRRAWSIYKVSGNPCLLLFAPIIFGINLTARLNLFIYWGYFLVFYYMCLEYQLTVLNRNQMRVPLKNLFPYLIGRQYRPSRHSDRQVIFRSQEG